MPSFLSVIMEILNPARGCCNLLIRDKSLIDLMKYKADETKSQAEPGFFVSVIQLSKKVVN